MFVMHGLKPEREGKIKEEKIMFTNKQNLFFFNVLFQAESTMQGKAKI